jgi:carbonic anhydrase
MKKLTTYSTLAITALFLATGCTQTINNSTKHESMHEATHGTHHKHWGYSAEVGPSHWGELNEKFHMCSEGQQQSPIDVRGTSDVDLPKLNINYKQGAKGVINNGHTVQVNIVDGDTLTLGGDAYTLKQFHFHTPSENHINGKAYPLEAHFVHATANGKLAVISVMFQEGIENPALHRIIRSFPLGLNQEKSIKLPSEYVNNVLPVDTSYYKFMGSLTTPPCSEQVKWFVMKEPLTASAAQIAAMHKEIGKNNNRPIQATNKRKIEE